MRRGLSISLMLLFCFGPLAGAFQAGSEQSLPACCRRHGAHHCAMSAESLARMASGSGPAFSAPTHCPHYPSALAASVQPASALAAAAFCAPALLVKPHRAVAGRIAARPSPTHTHAGRGPPASPLA
jgi:hypothetical protein